MFESLSGFFSAAFASKWAALAGALLIASPIIIHLINRMRFKRIRWAAMEFLLKAQKKVKRKMIVEQLLLLLLRILLMLLLGLLIARFTGFDLAGKDNRATQHLIVVDDSPSMADKWKPAADQAEVDGMEQARRVVVDQIVPAVGKAPTAQFLDVLVASRPDEVRPFGQIGTAEGGGDGSNLSTYLKSLTASTVRRDLPATLARAKEVLQKQSGADRAQVMYFLSDMRASDWAEQGEAVKTQLEDLKRTGVVVHLIDVVGDPFRRPEVRTPRSNDNVGIVELIPGKPIAARGEAVEFTLRVKNYGVAPVDNVRFAIKINGNDDKGRSVAFATLPPGQTVQERFELTFDEVGTDPRLLPSPDAVFAGTEKEAADLFRRFNLITASLDIPERGGIPADNVRHAVVEVREKLPVLVVDGGKADLPPGTKADGEFVYLNQFFTTPSSGGGGYAITETTAAGLEKADLSAYSLLLLLNVEKLSDAATRNIEAFVKNGGGCGVFLGDKVNGKEYNRLLYRGGAGFFPVALPDTPTPKPSDDQLAALLLKLSQQKFLLRDSATRSHPALAGMYQNERGQPIKASEEIVRWSQFITIKQYFKIDRNGPWRDDKSVNELFCMPNDGDLKEYAEAVNGIRDELTGLVADPELVKFKKPVSDIQDALKRVLFDADAGLGGLAIQFDRLLADGRSEGDPNEPLLRELWATPKAAELKGKIGKLRDRVKFGDPLYLAKQFGRGRVTLFLTTAGESWTDWPSSQPANYCFLPVVKEMVTYLSGGGGDNGQTCGQPIQFDLPLATANTPGYEPKVRKAFVTTYPKVGVRNTEAVKVDFVDLSSPNTPTANDLMTVSHADTAKPGVYFFGLVQNRPGEKDKPAARSVEFRPVVVNVDSREGDLRRVTTDDLAQNAPGLTVQSPDDAAWTDALQNKKTDLSEAGWLFLLVLLALIGEQALSVRLSRKGSDEAIADLAPSAVARRSSGPTMPTAAA